MIAQLYRGETFYRRIEEDREWPSKIWIRHRGPWHRGPWHRPGSEQPVDPTAAVTEVREVFALCADHRYRSQNYDKLPAWVGEQEAAQKAEWEREQLLAELCRRAPLWLRNR